MPYWKPLVIDGIPVDLAHLEPFEFQIVPTKLKGSATIRVAFNNHCFSAGFDAARHDAPPPKTHVAPHETRGFDLQRYELSKLLPAEIRGFDGKRVAQTRAGPLARVTLEDGREYAIFFTLKKTKSWVCEMFVISAYPLDRPKNNVIATGEMKFNVAVARVLDGKALKFPSGRF